MNEEFFPSSGVLWYSKDDLGCQLVVRVDQVIADYYRSLIPKWKCSQRPRYPAHVTVVRKGKDNPNLTHWGKHEGKRVDFLYSPVIKEGKIYFWLNCLSTRLEEIREELELSVEPMLIPPEGYKKYFHMTLANCKDVSK